MPSQKPPQTNITEKRSHIMVGTDHPAAHSLTPISPQKIYLAKSDRFSPNSLASQPSSIYSHQMDLPHIPISPQKIYLAKSDRFSPNSLASQPPTTLSHLVILLLTLASFPKNYLALSELAASLFCKLFIYQHLIKVYTSTFVKSAGVLQTSVISWVRTYIIHHALRYTQKSR